MFDYRQSINWVMDTHLPPCLFQTSLHHFFYYIYCFNLCFLLLLFSSIEHSFFMHGLEIHIYVQYWFLLIGNAFPAWWYLWVFYVSKMISKMFIIWYCYNYWIIQNRLIPINPFRNYICSSFVIFNFNNIPLLLHAFFSDFIFFFFATLQVQSQSPKLIIFGLYLLSQFLSFFYSYMLSILNA